MVWSAMLVVKKGDQLRRFSRGLLPFLLVLGVLGILVAAEPDLSVAMLYTLLMAVVLFAGGVRLGHFVLIGALAIPYIWREMERVQYALLRLTSFLDPGSTSSAVSYQLRQSLIAVGAGGLTGNGLGGGKQKLFFLPEPHTDFIFAIVGEELGFLGAVAVVLCFAVVAWRGLRAARRAPDAFACYLAAGATALLVIQAAINLSVVLALVPTKGLPLPFVSYGGSSLVASWIAAGLILNISQHEVAVEER
jgi:cell division protein FtsW